MDCPCVVAIGDPQNETRIYLRFSKLRQHDCGDLDKYHNTVKYDSDLQECDCCHEQHAVDCLMLCPNNNLVIGIEFTSKLRPNDCQKKICEKYSNFIKIVLLVQVGKSSNIFWDDSLSLNCKPKLYNDIISIDEFEKDLCKKVVNFLANSIQTNPSENIIFCQVELPEKCSYKQSCGY